jgi:hypothetical protein
MDDGTLRERYRQLMERGQAGAVEPAVPLETIQALAEDRLQGEARLAALDRILADEAARTEYEFLREIAGERPRQPNHSHRWLTAAAVLVAVGGGLLWRASSRSGPEPLRGPGSSVVLMLPEDGAAIAAGDHRFYWRPVNGAVGYVLEVVTQEGEVAFRAETTDTTAVLTASAGRPLPPGPAQWWVIARLGGATELRSAPRRVVLGR